MMIRINCSVGIIAYNEAGNMGFLFESLLNQKLFGIFLKEIIVVASGCTDNTVEIVSTFIKRDSRIKILIQEKREGKASAINLFLKNSLSDIVVILNADLLLTEDTLQKLIEPFFETKIGMTGGRAIPIDKRDNFMGFASNILWDMHHQISLKFPKLGELIAYRRTKDLNFPSDTVDDEGIIETLMTKQGYALQYVPDAVFYNKGVRLLSEFIRRRRNIFAGHLQLKHRTSYVVSTANTQKLFTALFLKLLKIAQKDFRSLSWTISVVMLELIARFLAMYDFYILNKDHNIWEIAKSSREIQYDKINF
jgi:biofilm PGA synthesis N-glycosyltransferase PgaC